MILFKSKITKNDIFIIIFYGLLLCTVICDEGRSIIKACQNKDLLIGTEKNMAKLIDVELGLTVRLECNFCGVKDDLHGKIWIYKNRSQSVEPIEVETSMESNTSFQKYTLTPDHILTIQNFTFVDSGIYSCNQVNDKNQNQFTYVLEATFDKSMPKVGKLSEWEEYKRLRLNPININFEKSDVSPYLQLKMQFNITFNVITLWEDWGKCEICGRRNGIRRKIGKCRLRPILFNHNQTTKLAKRDNAIKENVTNFLYDGYHIACASLQLNFTLPELSIIVRNIPDFEAVEACEGVCNPVFEGEATGKKTDFKFKMSTHIAEHGHITLSCPEVTLDSKVEWYKNKQLLNSSYRNNIDSEEEPHLTIDSFNTLYILQATKHEEAIYSCNVDGEKMQKFDVKVVSKSRILNHEFIRYSIYLAFVLSLTLSCYCTGMCVAWHRKSSFADPTKEKIYQP